MQDFFLKAENASALMDTLRAAGLVVMGEDGAEHPCTAGPFHALDVIGTLPGHTGYHANFRVLEAAPAAAALDALQPIIIAAPQSPERFWA